MPSTFTGQAKLHSRDSTFEHASNLLKIQQLLPELNQAMKVLDVGCGDARLSSNLVDKVKTVVGLDVHESALKQAAERGLQTLQTDIEQSWPLENESFDLILILDTLEHVSDCEFVLGEAKRVLKKGGHIIVGFPNHFDIRSRLEMLLGKGIVHWSHRKYEAEAWRYAHVRFLTNEELQLLFKNCGLKPDFYQYNFMGGGIVPTKLTPSFLRTFLTRWLPDLFSGKFTYRLIDESEKRREPDYYVFDRTVSGM